MYDEYGARLLEANVRSFLEFRGKINKGIRKTINTEPSLFFSYNNGITATASEVEYDASKRAITKLNNLQIVNGGQTTASLLLTCKKDRADLNNIHVQMKLNVVSDSKSDELISNIRDMPTRKTQLKTLIFSLITRFIDALKRFHVEYGHRRLMITLNRHAGTMSATSSSSYLNAQSKLTVAGKKAFKSEHPKSQLIVKTDLAKIYLIF